MNKNTAKIPKFMTEKKSIVLFLVTVLLFAILFILIYQPAGYMRESETLNRWHLLPWNKHIYTAIQVFIGFFILSLSRVLFYHINKRHSFTIRDVVLWIVGEIVVITLVLTVIASFLNAAEDLDFSDLMRRVFLNILLILVIPYVGAVLVLMLRERSHQIEELSNFIDKQQEERLDVNDNMNFYDRGNKLAFSTRRGNVLYIEAADNYSNIHYINEGKEDTFILHNSMKQLDSSDVYKGLLRCHRGYMVNIDNVKLLRKDKGGLVLELTQGARSIPVSRTYTERVVRFFAGDSEG